jgi:hypothetical protein
MAALATQGQGIEGLVYDKTVTADNMTGDISSGSRNYNLKFSYVVDGEAYKGSCGVSTYRYNATIPGVSTVYVTYLPSDPKQYELGTVSESRVSSDLKLSLLGAIGLLSIPLIWLIGTVVATRRDLAFAQVCAVVTGNVVNVFTKLDQMKNGSRIEYWLCYAFETAGKSFTREILVDQAFHVNHSEGQPIPVLFDPHNPESSRIPREMRTICTDAA